jgi:guanidinoacetate N-methyltransferase
MKKFKRTPSYELTLEIKRDDFIRPPRDAQRNYLLNKAVAEFAMDLESLNVEAARFVPGAESFSISERTHTELTDDEIMEDWQIPIMRRMAEFATESRGDILEVGFGRGVSATFIQECGARSHTIVECNESVVRRYETWKHSYPSREIRLIFGLWQDTTDQFEQYDGILFHTYPLNEEEYFEQAMRSVTFAEHFFVTAAAHLREGGAFTYLTNESDSISRGHQRLVLRHFRKFELSKIEPLNLPPDSKDTIWADSMVLIKATK